MVSFPTFMPEWELERFRMNKNRRAILNPLEEARQGLKEDEERLFGEMKQDTVGALEQARLGLQEDIGRQEQTAFEAQKQEVVDSLSSLAGAGAGVSPPSPGTRPLGADDPSPASLPSREEEPGFFDRLGGAVSGAIDATRVGPPNPGSMVGSGGERVRRGVRGVARDPVGTLKEGIRRTGERADELDQKVVQNTREGGNPFDYWFNVAATIGELLSVPANTFAVGEINEQIREAGVSRATIDREGGINEAIEDWQILQAMVEIAIPGLGQEEIIAQVARKVGKAPDVVRPLLQRVPGLIDEMKAAGRAIPKQIEDAGQALGEGFAEGFLPGVTGRAGGGRPPRIPDDEPTGAFPTGDIQGSLLGEEQTAQVPLDLRLTPEQESIERLRQLRGERDRLRGEGAATGDLDEEILRRELGVNRAEAPQAIEDATSDVFDRWSKATARQDELEREVASLEMRVEGADIPEDSIRYPPKSHPANGISRANLAKIIEHWESTRGASEPQIVPSQLDWWETIDPDQWRNFRRPGGIPGSSAGPAPLRATRADVDDAAEELAEATAEVDRLDRVLNDATDNNFQALEEEVVRGRQASRGRAADTGTREAPPSAQAEVPSVEAAPPEGRNVIEEILAVGPQPPRTLKEMREAIDGAQDQVALDDLLARVDASPWAKVTKESLHRAGRQTRAGLQDSEAFVAAARGKETARLADEPTPAGAGGQPPKPPDRPVAQAPLLPDDPGRPLSEISPTLAREFDKARAAGRGPGPEDVTPPPPRELPEEPPGSRVQPVEETIDRILESQATARPVEAPSTEIERAVTSNLTKWRTRIWDRAEPVRVFEEQAYKSLGREPTPEESVYTQARLYAGAPAAAAQRIRDGLLPAVRSVPNADEPLLNAYLAAADNVDKAKAIARRVEAQTREGLGDFGALPGQIPLDPAVIPDAKTLARQAGEKASAARRFSGDVGAVPLEEVQADLVARVGQERADAIFRAADEVWEFVKDLRNRKRDAGMFTPEFASQLERDFPHFIPAEILDYASTTAKGDPWSKLPTTGRPAFSVNDIGLRRLTDAGTKRARERPVNSIINLAFSTEELTRRNEIGQRLIQLAQENSELAEIVKPLGKQKLTNDLTTISVFKEGMKQEWVIPKTLESVFTLRQDKVEDWMRVAGILSGAPLFRAGTTTFNAAFIPVNAVRDAWTFMQRSYGWLKQNPAVSAGYLGRAYWDSFKALGGGKVPDLEALMREGGGLANVFVRQSPDELRRSLMRPEFGRDPATIWRNLRDVGLGGGLIRPLQTKGDFLGVVTDIAMLPLRPVQRVGEAVETAPRLAGFRLAKRAGKGDKEAALIARDITMDFARSGEWSRVVNQIIPYFNPAVQGPERLLTLDLLSKDKGRNMRGWLAMLGGIIMPQIVAEAWNRSSYPEAYADVPDYLKDRGLVVMLPYKIGDEQAYLWAPAPQEYQFFQVWTRLALEAALDGKEVGWKDIVSSFVQSTSPVGDVSGVAAPTLATIMEDVANYDFFRDRPIVPEGSDPLLEERRTLPGRTTAPARVIGEALDVSPRRVEHYVRGITGGVGQQALGIGDAALRAAGVEGREPTGTVRDIPVIGDVIGRFLRAGGGQQSEDARKEQDKALNAAKQTLFDGLVKTPVYQQAGDQRARQAIEISAMRRLESRFRAYTEPTYEPPDATGGVREHTRDGVPVVTPKEDAQLGAIIAWANAARRGTAPPPPDALLQLLDGVNINPEWRDRAEKIDADLEPLIQDELARLLVDARDEAPAAGRTAIPPPPSMTFSGTIPPPPSMTFSGTIPPPPSMVPPPPSMVGR